VEVGEVGTAYSVIDIRTLGAVNKLVAVDEQVAYVEPVVKVCIMLQRMEAVIKHGDKIDISDAINNLVDNQIEDYVFGKIGKATGQVSKEAGLNYGMGLNTIQRKFSKSVYEYNRGQKLSVYGG